MYHRRLLLLIIFKHWTQVEMALLCTATSVAQNTERKTRREKRHSGNLSEQTNACAHDKAIAHRTDGVYTYMPL